MASTEMLREAPLSFLRVAEPIWSCLQNEQVLSQILPGSTWTLRGDKAGRVAADLASFLTVLMDGRMAVTIKQAAARWTLLFRHRPPWVSPSLLPRAVAEALIGVPAALRNTRGGVAASSLAVVP